MLAERLVEEGPHLADRMPDRNRSTPSLPITEWGVWDSRIILNIEDWAGNYSVMPNGEA